MKRHKTIHIERHRLRQQKGMQRQKARNIDQALQRQSADDLD